MIELFGREQLTATVLKKIVRTRLEGRYYFGY